MKIGFYNDFQPCVVKDDGVVDISDAVGTPGYIVTAALHGAHHRQLRRACAAA